MSSSYTTTETKTFTLTHARHLAAKVATDLKRLQRFYGGISDERITHFGDYDPVGLDEYRRLKERAPRATFYIPQNFENYFKDNIFLKPKLLDKSSALLHRLVETQDADILTVIELMQRYGGGVEQEVLLL